VALDVLPPRSGAKIPTNRDLSSKFGRVERVERGLTGAGDAERVERGEGEGEGRKTPA